MLLGVVTVSVCYIFASTYPMYCIWNRKFLGSSVASIKELIHCFIIFNEIILKFNINLNLTVKAAIIYTIGRRVLGC